MYNKTLHTIIYIKAYLNYIVVDKILKILRLVLGSIAAKKTNRKVQKTSQFVKTNM